MLSGNELKSIFAVLFFFIVLPRSTFLVFATIHWPDNNENINHRSCSLVPFSSSKHWIIIRQANKSNKYSQPQIKEKHINKIPNQLIKWTENYICNLSAPINFLHLFVVLFGNFFFLGVPFFQFFLSTLKSFVFPNLSH